MTAAIVSPPEALTVEMMADPAIYHARCGYGFFTMAHALPSRKTGSGAGKAKKGHGLWQERQYHARQAGEIAARVAGSVDTYLSQATFRQFKGGRKLANFSRVGALWVDLDTYKVPRWRNWSAAQLVPVLLQECADRCLPLPSLVVDSGNGLYAKWVLSKPIPEAALPRWRAVQSELCARLGHMGADSKARDASRVLRAIGSTNSRTGRTVKVAWVNDYPFDDHGGYREPGVPAMLYDFDLVAQDILRESRERVREIQEERRRCREAAKAAGRERNESGLRRFNPRQLASDRYADIQRLLRMRGWEDGAPPGERDLPVFVGAAMLALMHPLPELRQRVAVYAARVAPTWTENEISACVHSVLDRAERSLRGEPNLWGGYQCDPRYTPGNAWLIEALSITEEEQRSLKTIIGRSEARRRDAARSAARRRASGASPRATFLDMAHSRQTHAADLRSQGLSWQEVGCRLGVSTGAARALAVRAQTKRTRPSVCLTVVKPRPAQHGRHSSAQPANMRAFGPSAPLRATDGTDREMDRPSFFLLPWPIRPPVPESAGMLARQNYATISIHPRIGSTIASTPERSELRSLRSYASFPILHEVLSYGYQALIKNQHLRQAFFPVRLQLGEVAPLAVAGAVPTGVLPAIQVVGVTCDANRYGITNGGGFAVSSICTGFLRDQRCE